MTAESAAQTQQSEFNAQHLIPTSDQRQEIRSSQVEGLLILPHHTDSSPALTAGL